MFLNYLEGEQFAASAMAIVVAGQELTTDNLGALLKAQAAVMTVSECGCVFVCLCV